MTPRVPDPQPNELFYHGLMRRPDGSYWLTSSGYRSMITLAEETQHYTSTVQSIVQLPDLPEGAWTLAHVPWHTKDTHNDS